MTPSNKRGKRETGCISKRSEERLHSFFLFMFVPFFSDVSCFFLCPYELGCLVRSSVSLSCEDVCLLLLSTDNVEVGCVCFAFERVGLSCCSGPRSARPKY